MTILNTTVTAYQYAAAISIALWTRLVFETDRLSLRYQNVSKEFTRSLQLNWASYGNRLVTLFLSLNLKQDSMKDFEIDLERARGSYTDPMLNNSNIYRGLSQFYSAPIDSEINFKWTKVMRESNRINDRQVVRTLPYQWHKGAETRDTTENAVFEKLGVSLAGKGLKSRKKILKSLLYIFASCTAKIDDEAPIVGVIFPATTQGGSELKESFCKGASYSTKSVAAVLKGLVRGAWLEKHTGFRGKGHCSGVTTLWTPTEKLRDYLFEIANELNVAANSKADVKVVLKDTTKERVMPCEKVLLEDMSEKVNRIQNLLQSSKWTYKKDGQIRTIKTEDLVLTRRFKYDYESGGRLYCDAQKLPKLTRRTLKVNGNETIELDFKSLHPTMLYHLNNFEAPKDCYIVDSVDRDVAKQALLVALNAKSRTSAKQAIAHKLNVSFNQAERIMLSCEAVHEEIEQHFYSSAWQYLQYLDSSIAMDVLTDLAELKIPTFPIHDSFIVDVQHGLELRAAMSNAYFKHVGKVVHNINEV